MRTLLFSVSCGGATAGNKDGRSSLAKTLLLTMELSEVFVVIVLLFDLGRQVLELSVHEGITLMAK